MSYYVPTSKGFDAVEKLEKEWSTREVPGSESLKDQAAGLVIEAWEESYLLGVENVKALNFALKKGWLKEDRRSISQVIGDISRYDRDLGKVMRTYYSIAKEEPVRDVDIDEALLIVLEHSDLEGSEDRGDDLSERGRTVTKALRSSSRGTKIQALDSYVRMLHEESLLESDESRVRLDTKILLDRLATE